MSQFPLIESFPALSSVSGLVHGFLLRNPEIAVDTDRDEALARLAPYYDEQLVKLGIRREQLATGDQVHDCRLAVIDGEHPSASHFPDTDGLITATPGQFLGVYVADCGAVFIVDPVKRACSVVHSGKKGTGLGIAPKAITLMQEIYGSEPADLIVQLAPCIRPPAYDIDFAAQIMRDCVRAGVPEARVIDCGTCTSSDLARYYSYRVEKGKTGRHFALIGWESI